MTTTLATLRDRLATAVAQGDDIAADAYRALIRGTEGTPVSDCVTDRIASLIVQATGALEQAQYEGSHTVRQEPAPVHGSPWETPDLPLDVQGALHQALEATRTLFEVAAQHRRLG